MSEPFVGAYLKLDRANKHIRDIDAAFQAFTDTHPQTLRVHGERQSGTDVFLFSLEIVYDTPIPDEIPLIIADAIHNLRVALDHAVWELVGHDGGNQDRHLKLPTGDSRKNYEATTNGIKTPRSDTKDFLKSLAIYPTGTGRDLYGLHRLDVAEKHTIITPVIHGTAFPSLPIINPDGGKGQTGLIEGPPGPNGNLQISLPAGWKIDMGEDIEATPAIFFGEIEVFPNKPVIPTLVHLSDAVSDTLGQFRAFVANRP